jgi:hypothetical protein
MSIETGTRWVHKAEGYGVEVVELQPFETVKTKDGDAANWSDGIPYLRDGGDPLEVYIRAEDDFLDKFEAETEDGFDAGDEELEGN